MVIFLSLDNQSIRHKPRGIVLPANNHPIRHKPRGNTTFS